MRRAKAPAQSIREAQTQMRRAAEGLSEVMTRPEPTPLDDLAPRSSQITLTQKVFQGWDLAFDLMLSALRKFQERSVHPDPSVAWKDFDARSDFTKADLFRCAAAAKDAAAVFAGIVKTEKEEKRALEHEELLREIADKIDGRPQ